MHACYVVLRDGNRPVTGGYDPTSNGVTLRTAYIFNVASLTFTDIAMMITDPCMHAACLLDNGDVFVSGGMRVYVDERGAIQKNPVIISEIYNITTDTWRKVSGFVWNTRYKHSCALLPNGKVLLSGGTNNPWHTELYNPTTDRFDAGEKLPRTINSITTIPVYK